jgi:hypothetical protein
MTLIDKPVLNPPIMKLSKSLLSAVMIGIAVHAATSCKKDKPSPEKVKQEAEKKSQEKTPTPDPCPACGMG